MIVKRDMLIRRLPTLAAAALGLALLLYVVWPWLPLPARAAPPRTIIFYGFSILGDTMNNAIFPAFQKEWEAKTGERVEFISSFGGSGTVTNQLIMGVPAHAALLSLESDAQRLAAQGVIPPNSWQSLPYGGVVNRTPFVILVRKGNPKGIHDFADLARPGVRVVHPDPLTSGGANWAILAEYGAGARAAGGDPAAGEAMLRGIWRNVVAQAPSAQAARSQFDNGFGDALITYEQEALASAARGQLDADIVYPRSTVLSEHTLVVLDRNIGAGERDVVEAFIAFLWSDTAQRLFAENGFRSVEPRFDSANPHFGQIEDPFRVADYGGWSKVKPQIIDAVWKGRVLTELSR
ncbi:MAG: sulfate ABC transporter substrate-binding protein [Anaerolineae bacterium]